MLLAIDPGHGFANKKAGVYDPGAGGGGLWESDLVLMWASQLQAACKDQKIKTFMTRTTQFQTTPLSTRDDRATAAKATHLISIHCNAASNVTARGVETFARDEADRELAKIVQKVTVEATGGGSRGVKAEKAAAAGRLALLNFAPPAALVELGFITNVEDRKYLADPGVALGWAQRLATELKAKYG